MQCGILCHKNAEQHRTEKHRLTKENDRNVPRDGLPNRSCADDGYGVMRQTDVSLGGNLGGQKRGQAKILSLCGPDFARHGKLNTHIAKHELNACETHTAHVTHAHEMRVPMTRNVRTWLWVQVRVSNNVTGVPAIAQRTRETNSE